MMPYPDWGLVGQFTPRLRRTAWVQLSQVSDKQLLLPTIPRYILNNSWDPTKSYSKRVILDWRLTFHPKYEVLPTLARQSSRPPPASVSYGLGRSWRDCLCNLHDPLPYVPFTFTTSPLGRIALNVRASYMFCPRHPLLPLPLRLPNPVEPSHVSA